MSYFCGYAVLKDTLTLIERQSHALETHSEHLFNSILSTVDCLTELNSQDDTGKQHSLKLLLDRPELKLFTINVCFDESLQNVSNITDHLYSQVHKYLYNDTILPLYTTMVYLKGSHCDVIEVFRFNLRALTNISQ